jgi:GDP-L-fucose synthase
MMGLNVLHQSTLRDVKKLVMVGTVCSYPKYACEPFSEDQLWEGYPEETNAPYGIAKKNLLVGAQAYREQYGLNTIFLMPANLYGPGDNFTGSGGHVVADMIRKFCTLDYEVHLWGDGSATRDFLYVEDAAEGIVKASELYNGSWPVNLGTGVEINMQNLADLIKAETKWEGSIVWDTDKPNGQPRRVLDTTRAKALFGWEASTPLKMGLQKTVDWYLDLSEEPDKLTK